MRGKLLGFALALLSVATVGVVQLNANAYVDSSRDCDQYAVVRCGTMSAQEARNKYDEGSKIFSRFGISKGDISGDLRDGVVYENGNVVVGGKVVATGARTAIRNMSGGDKIDGTDAAVYPASRMGSAQTAMVKFDKNGRFMFAIMKPCGNPVVATPTKPKPSAECKNLAIDKINRTTYKFSANAEVKNGAKVKSYTFTVKRKGEVLVNKTQNSATYTFNAPTAGNYKVSVTVNTSEGPQSGGKCEKELTVPTKPDVECTNLTVKPLSRSKFEFTATAEVNRAQVTGYLFEIFEGQTLIKREVVSTNKLSAKYVYNQAKSGDYTVKATVKSNLGPDSSPKCAKPFSVPPIQVTPAAACKSLAVSTINGVSFRFDGAATVTNSATVNGYTFEVSKAGTVIDTISVDSSSLTAATQYNQSTPGVYTVKLTVQTSTGPQTSANCVKTFTVEQPPVAACKSLTVSTINRTSFRFNAAATVENGAQVTGYTFDVSKDGTTIDTINVTSSALSATAEYNQATPGNYSVKLTVQTSEGPQTNANCVKPFTVEPPVEENPGVKIVKTVEGKKYTRVGVNVEYEYQVAVTNTGDVALNNVVVTDTPEAGITLTGASAGSISGNTWTYTIPTTLAVGQTINYTLSAKVPGYLAGTLTNTVCVDAPEVPGNPDDCDEADVDVPPEETPEEVVVCSPEDGTIITVPKEDEDKYAPVDSPKCKEIQICVLETNEVTIIKKSDFDSKLHSTDLSDCEETPVTPEAPVTPAPTELPYTGPAEVVAQVIGAMSLAGASAYYFTSRRSN